MKELPSRATNNHSSMNAEMKTSSVLTLASVTLDTWIRLIFTRFYPHHFSSIHSLTFINQPDLRMIDAQREGKQPEAEPGQTAKKFPVFSVLKCAKSQLSLSARADYLLK